MTAIDLSIRKAFEARLKVVCAAAAAADLIEWRNLPFDRQAALTTNGGLGYFLRPSYHPSDERARTLGPNPRVEHKGFFTVGIFVQSGLGPDLADEVAGLIRVGFVYGQTLTRDGLTIEITRRQRGTALTDDGWEYVPISIYWTLWRET
jgi:hypothetical protein